MDDDDNQVQLDSHSTITKEDNKENQAKEARKCTRQEITIPFIWEERPGAPKKDWKPERKPLPPAPLPAKYVASVPFKWEEKPGTPHQCFADETVGPRIPETVPENKSLPLPPAFFAQCEYDSDEDSSYDDDDYDDEPDWISEWGSEAVSIRTEESSSLAATLQKPFVNGLEETPGSPESSNSPSRYAAGGAASLRGATFLEYLFPLIPPKSELKNADNSQGKIMPVPERQPTASAEHKRLGVDCRRSGVFRRPLTLQELIMLSRRRSCHRKAAQMKKQNSSKDFAKKKAQGCFRFGDGDAGIAKLLGKDLLTLKLA